MSFLIYEIDSTEENFLKESKYSQLYIDLLSEFKRNYSFDIKKPKFFNFTLSKPSDINKTCFYKAIFIEFQSSYPQLVNKYLLSKLMERIKRIKIEAYRTNRNFKDFFSLYYNNCKNVFSQNIINKNVKFDKRNAFKAILNKLNNKNKNSVLSRNKNPFFMNINLNQNEDQKEAENFTLNEKVLLNSHRNREPKLCCFSPFNKANNLKEKKICNIVLGNTGTLLKHCEKRIPIFKGKIINTFLLNMENKEFHEYKTINSQSKTTFLNLSHKKSKSINNYYSSQQLINVNKPPLFTPKRITKMPSIPSNVDKIKDSSNILDTISSRYGMKSNSSGKKILKPFHCFKTIDMYYN